jgi:hypothetical protein
VSRQPVDDGTTVITEDGLRLTKAQGFSAPYDPNGVYVRPKGKPFTSMHMTTCGSGDFDNDPTTPDEELCSLEVAILVRDKGKPSVDNVSKELLTMCVDTDGDLTCDERIFLR